jgi:hypothetical protein
MKRHQVSRAQRFPLRIHLQYRKSNMPDWHQCKTVNISRTGILFRTNDRLEVNSLLEIQVLFPREVRLACHGSVVRTLDSACAVRIHNCHLYAKGSSQQEKQSASLK